MTSVVQSDCEMHATAETWKAAMLAKGWHSERRRSDPRVICSAYARDNARENGAQMARTFDE